MGDAPRSAVFWTEDLVDVVGFSGDALEAYDEATEILQERRRIRADDSDFRRRRRKSLAEALSRARERQRHVQTQEGSVEVTGEVSSLSCPRRGVDVHDAPNENQDVSGENDDVVDEYLDAADEYQDAADEHQDAADEHQDATDEHQDATDGYLDAADENHDVGDEKQDVADENQDAVSVPSRVDGPPGSVSSSLCSNRVGETSERRRQSLRNVRRSLCFSPVKDAGQDDPIEDQVEPVAPDVAEPVPEQVVGPSQPVRNQKRARPRKRKPVEIPSIRDDCGLVFEDGVRRSTRVRHRPLAFWNAETVRYERRRSQIMPTVASYVESIRRVPTSDRGQNAEKVQSLVKTNEARRKPRKRRGNKQNP